MPRISVVTPSLNQARFLAECMDSVLDQEYPALEYIVIDGGSDDGSLDIIEARKERLAHWVSEPDGGQSQAINKGFAAATGELVTWLNADDFLYPDALKAMGEAYAANPQAAFYWGDGNRVTEAGRLRLPHYPADYSVVFRREVLISGLNYLLQPATFIHGGHLRAIGGLREELHYGMDTDLWIRLSEQREPMRVEACIAANREYSDTKTSAGGFARAEELRQLAEEYSGDPQTPGATWYALQTLWEHAQTHPEGYPLRYEREIHRAWCATAALMRRRWGCLHGVFPVAERARLEGPGALWQRVVADIKARIYSIGRRAGWIGTQGAR